MIKELFFINNGIMTMIYYFSILHNIIYINKLFISINIFNYFNFSCTFGFLLSFTFNKFFFKNWNNLKLMIFLSILIHIIYGCFIILIFINFNEILKIIILMILSFLLGFTSYFYQELSYYLADLYSFAQIKNINIGIGVGSLWCSLFLLILELILENNIFLIFNLGFIIYIIYYYIIFYLFIKNSDNSIKLKSIENKINFKLLIKSFMKKIDLFFSIFITNLFTFLILPNIYKNLKFKNKNQYLYIIFLVSSISDLFSKMINEKLVLKNKLFIHIINFLRILGCFIFVILVKYSVGNDIYQFMIVSLLIIVFIVTNGLIINSCFFLVSKDEYEDIVKFADSKMIIFGIYLGIAYSGISNLAIF